VSLASIGLLTTALFVTHLAAQLPAGIWSDRYGSRAVALGACIAGMAGNLILLQGTDYGLATVGRLVVGLGSGAGFVAGFDLVRAGGGGTVLQGAFGGATMAGGGLALMVLPALTDATNWRAPYWTALVLALAAALPVYAAGGLRPVGRAARGVLRDRTLLPVGILHAATFGLAVIAGNWVVTLLERDGASPAAAGLLGGLVLLAGIVTRPLGGALARRAGAARRQLVAGSLVAASAGTLLLAASGPVWVGGIGALALGLAAGLPFAALFDAAQQTRPDAPGAAVALVNACAILAILVGTPLAGLAFELPGEGVVAFAVIGTLIAASLFALPRARL
jgi:MFS family permease